MKNNKGITLIALIITVIILIILAMVSAKILLNNGIIDKADKGANQFIEEQIKISYSEYKAAQFDNDDKALAIFIEDNLRNRFKNDNIKSVTVNGDEIIVTTEMPSKDRIYVYNVKTDIVEERTN